ncbi:MAG: helix-turn-helix domain-containing protein, partial [Arenicellales bacterium]
MSESTDDFLTTREVALLLRVKERKVYDLVARQEIPFVKATGKLLFHRHAIEAWLAASR